MRGSEGIGMGMCVRWQQKWGEIKGAEALGDRTENMVSLIPCILRAVYVFINYLINNIN